MKCVKCNERLKDGAKFCSKCGTKIPYCTGCGKLLVTKVRFCEDCGTPVPEAVQALFPEIKEEKEPTSVKKAKKPAAKHTFLKVTIV